MSIRASIATQDDDAGRRGEPRYQIHFDALANIGQDASTSVTIRNLSASGLLLESTLPIQSGDLIAIHLSNDELIEAKVVWKDGDYHGCAFEHPLGDDQLEYARRQDGKQAATPDAPSQRDSALGEAIRKARMAKGFSATRLAEELGVSRPSLWAWETGRVSPKRENLERLSELVDLPLEVLLQDATNFHGHGHQNADHIQAVISQAKAAISKSLGLEEDQIEIAIRF